MAIHKEILSLVKSREKELIEEEKSKVAQKVMEMTRKNMEKLKEVSIMKDSKKMTLNSQDFVQVARNSFIFAAPALLVFLTTFQATHNFQMAAVAIETWVINTAVDLLRKFVAGGK